MDIQDVVDARVARGSEAMAGDWNGGQWEDVGIDADLKQLGGEGGIMGRSMEPNPAVRPSLALHYIC
jgi:hypothetical protein